MVEHHFVEGLVRGSRVKLVAIEVRGGGTFYVESHIRLVRLNVLGTGFKRRRIGLLEIVVDAVPVDLWSLLPNNTDLHVVGKRLYIR